jgi:hypothetical protein
MSFMLENSPTRKNAGSGEGNDDEKYKKIKLAKARGSEEREALYRDEYRGTAQGDQGV